MNNQKLTKLQVAAQEISVLKKNKTFLKKELLALAKELIREKEKIDDLKSSLNKIRCHWIYKLINWFKR